MIVKICGLRSQEAAERAIESGTDLLGVIMVPNRKRTVLTAVAKEISRKTKEKRKLLQRKFQSSSDIIEELKRGTYSSHNEYFEQSSRLIHENGPFLVGVFRNQSVSDVFQMALECGVDFIQLHGSENVDEFIQADERLGFGIIKRFVIPDHTDLMAELFPKALNPEYTGFFLPLLDSEAGGEGKPIDWKLINGLNGRFLLAGGLSPGNLHETKPFLENVVGFDVSGGVEDESGEKDLKKIDDFIVNAREL